MKTRKLDQQEVEPLLKKMVPIITQLSYRYRWLGHYLLEQEELYSEGLLVFTKIWKKGYRGDEFEKVFRTSLKNRFKNLLTRSFRDKRYDQVIDISEAYNLVGFEGTEAIFQFHRRSHIEEMVRTSNARIVLKEIMDPSDETIWAAIQEYVRGRHLLNTCQRQRERPFRISNTCISKSTGLTISQVVSSIREIRFQLRNA